MPRYHAVYERVFDRPTTVTVVCDLGEALMAEIDRGEILARGILNATDTFERSYVTAVRGAERFTGR